MSESKRRNSTECILVDKKSLSKDDIFQKLKKIYFEIMPKKDKIYLMYFIGSQYNINGKDISYFIANLDEQRASKQRALKQCASKQVMNYDERGADISTQTSDLCIIEDNDIHSSNEQE